VGLQKAARRLGPSWAATVSIFACMSLFAPQALSQSSDGDQPAAELRMSPFSGVLQACDDPAMLDQLAVDFANREREFWNSSLTITGITQIIETGYRLNGRSFIPRRYCQAQASFNDGRERHIVYSIGASTAFIGIGSGVLWCVQGLDRHHAFSPNCRAAGP